MSDEVTPFETEALSIQLADHEILRLENDILRSIATAADTKLKEAKSLVATWRSMATLAEETAENIKGDLLEDLTRSALLGQKVSDLRLCADCLEIILDGTETTG